MQIGIDLGTEEHGFGNVRGYRGKRFARDKLREIAIATSTYEQTAKALARLSLGMYCG